MDSNLFVFGAFLLSTLIDVLIVTAVFFLFYKIFKTKVVALENNQEIYEHDKMLIDLQEQIDNVKS